MISGRALLQGVITPLITAMNQPGMPSVAAAQDHLSALHGSGVNGLMLFGSNGEGPLLPTSVLGDFAAGVADLWRELRGGPVLVNVTAAGTAEALERARAVAAANPEALVLSPPIYFHHRDDEIISHYAACADLGVPVVAYNIPRYSNPITEVVFEALLEMDHVIGLKDSSGDPHLFRQLVETTRSRRPGFGISQGAETHLLPALRLGADGIVPGIANLAPAAAVNLYGAHRRGDHAEAEQAQKLIDDLLALHTVRPGVPAVKTVLEARGLCPSHVAGPFVPCTPAERRELLEVLAPYHVHLVHA